LDTEADWREDCAADDERGAQAEEELLELEG
jgi:hypothetical protein